MRKLVWFWNLVYYCMYQLQIASLKKSTPKEIEESAFKNPKTGYSITRARIQFGALFLSIEIILINLLQVLLQKNLVNYILDNQIYAIITAIFLATSGSIFDYYVIHKNKTYLKYFQQFDQITRDKIIIYMILCLVASISSIILAIISFTWLPR